MQLQRGQCYVTVYWPPCHAHHHSRAQLPIGQTLEGCSTVSAFAPALRCCWLSYSHFLGGSAARPIPEFSMGDLSMVEETLKRISSHKGILGSVIINGEGIPIRCARGLPEESLC